ncbi:MAG: hypothetical protein PHY47_20370 [Lachnospiraceae bacterium]|nr:hypothetical protein [Lachnospiraceae bacterium]
MKFERGDTTGVFSENGTGTSIVFTEEVSVKNPIMNLLIGIYLKKQQNRYIQDLRKALGEHLMGVEYEERIFYN